MKNNNNFSNITLEQVAGMVARGFEQMATKEEIARMATKEDLQEVRQELKQDIAGVRTIVGDTYSVVEELKEKDYRDLKERVELLEEAVFPGTRE
ncbi:MAG: hypothetical protein ACE5FJ_06845 [Gemmatimonadales bacterium]